MSKPLNKRPRPSGVVFYLRYDEGGMSPRLRRMRVLFAGEDPAPGSGAYLLGVLRILKAKTVHVPSGTRLGPQWLRQRYDVIAFSDYHSDVDP